MNTASNGHLFDVSHISKRLTSHTRISEGNIFLLKDEILSLLTSLHYSISKFIGAMNVFQENFYLSGVIEQWTVFQQQVDTTTNTVEAFLSVQDFPNILDMEYGDARRIFLDSLFPDSIPMISQYNGIMNIIQNINIEKWNYFLGNIKFGTTNLIYTKSLKVSLRDCFDKYSGILNTQEISWKQFKEVYSNTDVSNSFISSHYQTYHTMLWKIKTLIELFGKLGYKEGGIKHGEVYYGPNIIDNIPENIRKIIYSYEHSSFFSMNHGLDLSISSFIADITGILSVIQIQSFGNLRQHDSFYYENPIEYYLSIQKFTQDFEDIQRRFGKSYEYGDHLSENEIEQKLKELNSAIDILQKPKIVSFRDGDKKIMIPEKYRGTVLNEDRLSCLQDLRYIKTKLEESRSPVSLCNNVEEALHWSKSICNGRLNIDAPYRVERILQMGLESPGLTQIQHKSMVDALNILKTTVYQGPFEKVSDHLKLSENRTKTLNLQGLPKDVIGILIEHQVIHVPRYEVRRTNVINAVSIIRKKSIHLDEKLQERIKKLLVDINILFGKREIAKITSLQWAVSHGHNNIMNHFGQKK